MTLPAPELFDSRLRHLHATVGQVMEIRVTGHNGPRIPTQSVTGTIEGGKFVQTGGWINFKDARLVGVDLSGIRHLFTFTVNASVFEDCTFEGVRFKSHSFGGVTSREQAVFRNCRFDRCRIDDLQRGENARFEHCSFRRVNFKRWQADHCEFVDCVFSGRLYDIRFAGRPWDVERYGARDRELHEQLAAKYHITTPYRALERKTNEFRGNDFREADLVYVAFVYGIDLRAQKLPQGPQYLRLDHPRERIERARAVIARWSDDAVREQGLFLLRLYSEDGYEEQDEIFLNRTSAYNDEQRRLSQPTYDLLASVLERDG